MDLSDMMKSKKAVQAEPDYIPLKDACAYARRALRFAVYAKAVLRNGLTDGVIKARAQAILKEYTCGNIRSFERRRQKLQIELTERSESAMLLIEPRLLRGEPRGARLLCNWRSGHLAWIAPPPTRYSINKITGVPRATLPVRYVMYDVEVERAAVQQIVERLLANNRISEAIRAKVTEAYNTEENWRRKLPDYFAAAEKGELNAFHPYKHRGGKASLNRSLKLLATSIKSDSTAKRIGALLVGLDESACSARKQHEQQLTMS